MDRSASTAPLVSVVTPFYNTAEHLAACIESVLAQTYEHFEYVIVDNQSDDGSSEIAARYAAADPRIRLLRLAPFVGQVENYNRALEAASPDAAYIKLVQADDRLLPRCLEEMVRVAELDPRIAIVSSYYLKGERSIAGTGVPFGVEVVDGREICRQMLLAGVFPLGSPSAQLYRGDVVRSRRPFYELGRRHEDTEAAYEILTDRSLGFVHQVLTFLRTDDDSTLGTIHAFHGGVLDHLIVLQRYGPRLLSDAELSAQRHRERQAYFGYLGTCVLARRSAEFWDFHRSGLASIGERLRRRDLARYAALAALRLLLNPLDTVTGGWRSVVAHRGR
jgi:glycosyltransferase involved in cell wall biosynthesis